MDICYKSKQLGSVSFFEVGGFIGIFLPASSCPEIIVLSLNTITPPCASLLGNFVP